MAWTRVQSAGANTFGSSIGATFGSNVSAGNKILAIVGSSFSTVPSTVQDAAANNWVLLTSITSSTGSVWLYALDVPAGDVGTKPTITATWSNSNGQSILIQEVSGLLAGTASILDGTAGTLTGATAATGSPTYSSSTANEYLLCIYGDDDGNATVAAVNGTWTLDTNNQSSFSDASAEYKNSTGGAETSGFTGASTNGWAVLTVAIKLAGGTTAAPYPAQRQAIRAKLPLLPLGIRAFKGRTSSNKGAPVRNPPAKFFQKTSPVRARTPLPWHGRVYSNPGAPVKNPTPGPVFYQKPFPAQARIPLPKRGRAYSSPGGPVSNPPAPGIGPVFRQKNYPARIHPVLPSRGRITFNAGAPVSNPTVGPPDRRGYKIILRHNRGTLPPRGRTYSTRLPAPATAPGPASGPAFYPAVQAIRAKILRFPVAGSVLDGFNGPAIPGALNGAGFGGGTGSGGAPLKNPVVGPVFRQAVHAFRAQVPLHPRAGRITGISSGGPVNNPIPPVTYLFTGHYGVEYFDYVDTGTEEILICIPGGSYRMTPVSNRPGLTIPPPDGRWIGESQEEDEAAFINRAEEATLMLARARRLNAELQARMARGGKP